MGDPFHVIEVSANAPHAPEAMGTKPKFWFHDPELGPSLYKQSRLGTGEDWAEKIAAELAGLLGLPHAQIELATWHGLRGTVSPSFVPAGGTLMHGNEMLLRLVPGYPTSKSFYRVSQHTLDRVLGTVRRVQAVPPLDWRAPPSVRDSIDVFIGYLLLDAWISNTDRHHENWAWVFHKVGGPPTMFECHLAPTYDHASSLGRNEPIDRKQDRLTTRDKGFSVEAYVEKAASALYATESDRKPLTPLEAYQRAAAQYPQAARFWLDRLADIADTDTKRLFERVPPDRMSLVDIEFAERMLDISGQKLLRLREDVP